MVQFFFVLKILLTNQNVQIPLGLTLDTTHTYISVHFVFQSSEGSLPEYMRWLSNRGHTDIIEEEDKAGDRSKPLPITQSMDDGLLLFMARKRQPASKQKYIFLSDKDTNTQGMFSEKYKGERENKDIPRPYQGDMPKSYSALGGMISASPDPSKTSMSNFLSNLLSWGL